MKRPPLNNGSSASLVVGELMWLVRGQFCGDVPEKEWFKSHYRFLKVNVVLWPARFMAGKGFAVGPERYKAILTGIFREIERHGDTKVVRYWPGYLMKCVQDHFRHHWEDYYAEAKSVRAAAEGALLAMGAGGPGGVDLTGVGEREMEAMAAAHRLLKGPRKRKAAPRGRQGELGL